MIEDELNQETEKISESPLENLVQEIRLKPGEFGVDKNYSKALDRLDLRANQINKKSGAFSCKTTNLFKKTFGNLKEWVKPQAQDKKQEMGIKVTEDGPEFNEYSKKFKKMMPSKKSLPELK